MRKMLAAICVILLSAFVILSYTLATPAQIAPIEISAEDLWTEFLVNEDTAKFRYDNRTLSVTGEIAEIAESFMGYPCILLENGIDSIPDGIFCMFPEGYDIFAHQIGDILTVTGECSVGIHIAGDDAQPYIFIYV